METLDDLLIGLRNYCVRYGEIKNDASCDIAGNSDRITTFVIDNKSITIGMHNGKVSSISYR